MNNKTKAAIEEAAKEKYPEYLETSSYYHTVFRQGAQEVIEHPEKYGLFTREQVLEIIRKGFSNE